MRTLVLIGSATALLGIGCLGSEPGAVGTPSDPPSSNACIQEKNAILADLANIAALHQAPCAADAECSLVDLSIPCQSSCQTAIIASHHAIFVTALTAYATTKCPTASKGCGIDGNCAPLDGAKCVAGVCRPVVAGVP